MDYLSQIYQINEEIEKLSRDWIDMETGEINEEIDTQIRKLMSEKPQIIEEVACLVKQAKSMIDGINLEIMNLKDRKKALLNFVENAKYTIGEELNHNRYQTPRVDIRFRKSTSLKDDGVSAEEFGWIYPHLVTKKVTYALDKKKITQALKDGELIDHMQLEEKQNTIIK